MMRRLFRIPAVTLGTAALALAGLIAAALWGMSRITNGSVTVDHAVTGFSVQRGVNAPMVATGPSDTVILEVNPADALAVAYAPGNEITIPFTVAMMVSDIRGINYTIAVDTPATGSFFHTAEIKVAYPVQGSCHVSTGDVLNNGPQPINGVSPVNTPRAMAQVTSHTWCLVVKRSVDVYENIATATGTDLMGQPQQATASWWAPVGPELASASLNVSLTHTTTWPERP